MLNLDLMFVWLNVELFHKVNFRKSNLITTKPEMMMIYVYVSSLLKGHSDWEDKLTEFIGKIDFSNADILKSKPEKIVKEVGLDV